MRKRPNRIEGEKRRHDKKDRPVHRSFSESSDALSDNDSLAIHLNDCGRERLHPVLLGNPTVHVQPKLEIKRISSKLRQVLTHLSGIPNKDSFDLIFQTRFCLALFPVSLLHPDKCHILEK